MRYLKKFENLGSEPDVKINNMVDIKCVKVVSDTWVTYIIYVNNRLYTSNDSHIDSIGMIDEWFYGFNDGLEVFKTKPTKVIDFKSDIFDNENSLPPTYDDMESLINGKDIGLL